MSVARIDPISALHNEAHRQLGHALRSLRTRFIEGRRQRLEEHRMLFAVQQLDHPGVLADVQAACRSSLVDRVDGR